MLVSQLWSCKAWQGPGYIQISSTHTLALYHIGRSRGILAESSLPRLANLLGAGYVETLAPVRSIALEYVSKGHETRPKV